MKNFLNILIIVLLLFSCSSKKDIVYLQDIEDESISTYVFQERIIKPDDIVRINVNAILPETAVQFNRISTIQSSNSIDLVKLDGYSVNSNGEINFPTIGRIKVSGLTIDEAEEKIYKILDNGYLSDHNVEIKILNSSFTILGEVSRPGRYNFLENNFNIIEAIGMAGDLTINGKRKDLKLIRTIDDNRKIFNIDLTNSNYLSSEAFQIYPGDIIIINPNTNRVKSAGIIGNSGTLISLLSFLLTSLIVIRN